MQKVYEVNGKQYAQDQDAKAVIYRVNKNGTQKELIFGGAQYWKIRRAIETQEQGK